MGTRTADRPVGVKDVADAFGALTRAQLRMIGVPLFVLYTWFGAHIAVPIPPYGVPMTLQTLAVFCCALCLGPLFGSAAMGLYVLLGMVGLPMFAEGTSGVDVVFGQTGGYLIGFVACQPVICRIVRRGDGSVRGWGAMFGSMIAANVVVFGIGVPWLYVTRQVVGSPISWGDAWWYGCAVFVPWTILKAVAAVWVGRIAAPWASRRVW